MNLHWFDNLAEAKRSIEAWMIDYNVSRPHMGIGNMPPTEYALQVRLLEKIQVQTLPETNIEIGSSLLSTSQLYLKLTFNWTAFWEQINQAIGINSSEEWAN